MPLFFWYKKRMEPTYLLELLKQAFGEDAPDVLDLSNMKEIKLKIFEHPRFWQALEAALLTLAGNPPGHLESLALLWRRKVAAATMQAMVGDLPEWVTRLANDWEREARECAKHGKHDTSHIAIQCTLEACAAELRSHASHLAK